MMHAELPGGPPELSVRRATAAELAACLALRHEVFVVGQGVPLALECDGADAAATHVVAYLGEAVVGTARLRAVAGHAKLERVAVAAEARGKGVGVALMRALEGEARAAGYDEACLHAQASVIAFYERLGWHATGPIFHEAGIAHREMHKRLDRAAP